jgi:hypothetical protein
MKGMSVPSLLWGGSSRHGGVHTEPVTDTEFGREDAT